MGLLGEARAISNVRSAKCRFVEVREALGDEGPELDEAILDESVSFDAIRAILMRRGISVSRETLRKHRPPNKCHLCAE